VAFSKQAEARLLLDSVDSFAGGVFGSAHSVGGCVFSGTSGCPCCVFGSVFHGTASGSGCVFGSTSHVGGFGGCVFGSFNSIASTSLGSVNSASSGVGGGCTSGSSSATHGRGSARGSSSSARSGFFGFVHHCGGRIGDDRSLRGFAASRQGSGSDEGCQQERFVHGMVLGEKG
jgi:hypothetical protein